MIVTVTVNAALDRTLTVPVFQIGYRHRSSEVLTLAGGKGINVARALKLLDVPVVATGLTGGRTGTRIVEELTVGGHPQRLRPHRRRVAHLDGGRRSDLGHVHGDQRVGARGDVRRARDAQEKLHYLSRGADFVVLAGSLPRKVPTEFYADAIRDLVRRDVRVVLDSEGESLSSASRRGRSSSRRTSARPSSSSARSSRTTTTS